MHTSNSSQRHSAHWVLSALALPALVLLWTISAVTAGAQESPTTSIKVNQAGYLLQMPKVGVVSAPGTVFFVKRLADGEKVYEGTLGPMLDDALTGDRVATADFSGLNTAGEYYLEVPGVGRSWKFSIGPNVYSRSYYLGMRAFYGQRCGTAVDLGSEFPTYKYPACHLHGEFHATSGKTGRRNNIGGWHDAGDYGRYVVNSSVANGTLLWAWELFDVKIRNISLNIPESGKHTPDILSETRWNQEWVLKMQDKDGGAWHKQTSESFVAFIEPQNDTTVSYVIGTGKAPFKNTCATADLAAAAAIAARVYEPFDSSFASRNLKAAVKAWKWAIKNPNVPFQNPPGVVTGAYPDTQCSDEMLWAAAELWRTTGKKEYNRYFVENYAKHMESLASPSDSNWRDVGSMALWGYALTTRKGTDAGIVESIKKVAVEAAHKIVVRTRANPYRMSMQAHDFRWGSNGIAANYGMYLLMANHFTPDPAFRETALDNLHYLLGRNTFSLSWQTQVGENPFLHPHHRPSGAFAEPHPWPGMLSGGPNPERQDPLLKAMPADLPPAKVYVDDTGSYASNEIAINWQATFVFLLAAQLP